MCVSTYNDVLDDSKCSQQEKLTVQRCSEFLCPQWKTGDWSEVRAGRDIPSPAAVPITLCSF